MTYNAFISYSHYDINMAAALEKGLMRFAIPWYRRSKLNIFRDESGLSVTPHLWDNIKKSLSDAEYFIFMASPQSKDSKWVGKELNYWLKHKSIDKLIIVVTYGEMNWDAKTKSYQQSELSCIPDVLNNVFKQEPFYVDLRALKSKGDLSLKNSIFNKEVLKIAAELYHTSQKEIAGEEVKTQTRVKRLTIGIVSSLFLAFITALFFYFQSNKNEKLAIKNEKLAIKNEKLAIENETEALDAKERVKGLLKIALQGRGDQYDSKPIDTILETLEDERTRPLNFLIKSKAAREQVGATDNYDYLVWIDVPSFRTDSILEVSYEWELDGYRYVRGDKMISKEASTGYAVGYRGTNKIKDYIDITVKLKGDIRIEKRFNIREFLNIAYDLPVQRRIERK